MKQAVILIGKNVSPALAKERTKDAFVIGADQGAAYALEHGIHLDVVIGDFDSVNEEQKERIASSGAQIVSLPHHKDVTDTAAALDLCIESHDRIIILGGIAGDRIEHFLANVDLLRAHPEEVYLEDDDAWCVALSKGQLPVRGEDVEYLSIFALEDAVVSLEGFEYPLSHYSLPVGDPLGVSNELVDETGRISVESGLLLVVVHKRKDQ